MISATVESEVSAIAFPPIDSSGVAAPISSLTFMFRFSLFESPAESPKIELTSASAEVTFSIPRGPSGFFSDVVIFSFTSVPSVTVPTFIFPAPKASASFVLRSVAISSEPSAIAVSSSLVSVIFFDVPL